MVKKNDNMKNNRKKYLIIGASLLLIFSILFVSELNPLRLLSSIYNANDIEDSIGKIKIGDIINYDINGYSDWQVVSIDKNNNTLDVVSRTNVEDVSLTTKEDYENALDIFQEVANKYTDNKYAIKARCVTRADLDNFGFDEVFWNADVYNGSVAFTNGKISYNGSEITNKKYYFLPYINYMIDEDYSNYHVGDELNLGIAGIDKWILVEQPYSYYNNIALIPSVPIEINYDDYEFSNNPSEYVNNILNNIKNSDSKVIFVGNYFWDFGYNLFTNYENVRNHYSDFLKRIVFIIGSLSSYSGINYLEVGMNTLVADFENNEFNYSWDDYRIDLPFSAGFRPVVTLKYSDKLIDSKILNTDLQIGDNVNYSANEYNNWRVLSIDEDNGTVDIISGGIVKNIKLYGIADYNNYDDIMQNEVDSYKIGDNAISARLVEYGDLVNLNKMNDRVNVKYWTKETKDYNKKAIDDTSSPYAANAYYDASLMYYDLNESVIQRKWVSLYIFSGLTSGGNSILSSNNGNGDLSFTAGIRPVITLKIDAVKKISEDEKDSIIDNEKSQQQKIDDEQKNNSDKYVTNDRQKSVINNYTNIIRKNDNKDSKNNENVIEGNDKDYNEEVNNYYNENSKKGSTNKLVKYIIIAIVVLNVAILGQVVLSVFIIKNIKNIKKRKK